MRPAQLDSHDCVPLAASTRALLCHFAAGDIARPLPGGEADWEAVFQGLCRHGLLGLAQRYLAHREPLVGPPEAFRRAVREACYLSVAQMALLYRNIATVLTHLAASGIEYLVLKGPALAHSVYPQPALRTFTDLDLMVRGRDLPAMHQLLLEQGFALDSDPSLLRAKRALQATIHEVSYWHDTLRLSVEVHYDDLLNTGLPSRDVQWILGPCGTD